MNHIVIRPGDPPLSCQHYRVNPEDGCCEECGELMVEVTVEPHYILSAPNAAACTNPACLQAMSDGTYDDNDPPAGCTNPSGTYIPGRAVQVLVGVNYSYRCQRCGRGGQIAYGEPMVLPCGESHQGYVRVERVNT